MQAFDDSEISQYMEMQNDCYRYGMVSMVVERFRKYVDETLGEAVIANKKIDPTDIERYLLRFLFNANLGGKTKEELAEMVTDHFRIAWKREIDGLEFSLASMPAPVDKGSLIDRLVTVAKIDELKKKLSE